MVVTAPFLAGVFTPPSYGYLYLFTGSSKSVVMTINAIPGADVTITPSSSTLTFNPSSIQWTSSESQLTKSFTVTVLSNAIPTGPQTITYALSGTDHTGFAAVGSSTLTVLAQGSFSPASFGYFYGGAPPRTVAVTISVLPQSDVTITPSCTDLTFSPLSYSWSNTGSVTATFSVSAVSSASTLLRHVTYTISGTDAGGFPPPAPSPVQIYSSGLFIPPTYPAMVAGGHRTLHMAVSELPGTSVDITPSGSYLTFSPHTIRFNTTTPLAFTVYVNSSAPTGPLSIQYAVSGTDSAGYKQPSSSSVQIFAAGSLFFIPPAWPYLYPFANVTVAMDISTLPVTGVTISLHGAGLVFYPQTIGFTPSTSTPVPFNVYTGAVAVSALRAISYSISGANAGQYSVPGNSTIQVYARGLLFACSHCSNGRFAGAFNVPSYPYMCALFRLCLQN